MKYTKIIQNYHISHLSEELKSNITLRLKRAKGHIEAINKMIEEDRSCEDIITQLYAVKSAINETIVKILEGHIESNIKSNNKFSTDDTIEIVDLLIKVLKMK
ncbi:MAG: metal-sensitive transcriptional regulator [Brevinematia bacterium]